MSHRRRQLQTISGFTVIAIPDSGLFVKGGKIVTGHGTEMDADDEMPLFTRRIDADRHAFTRKNKWQEGDVRGHEWDFIVVPVLVRERL